METPVRPQSVPYISPKFVEQTQRAMHHRLSEWPYTCSGLGLV